MSHICYPVLTLKELEHIDDGEMSDQSWAQLSMFTAYSDFSRYFP